MELGAHSGQLMQSAAESKAAHIRFNPVLIETGDPPPELGVIAVASALISIESGVKPIAFNVGLVVIKWSSVRAISE
jgi:hypothetical protein